MEGDRSDPPPHREKLVEIARLDTAVTNADELIFTSSGDVIVIRGLSSVEAWDVRNRTLLWTSESSLYDHHIPPSDKELVWLDQSAGQSAVVRAELRSGKEQSRTPLEFDDVRLWNAVFGWGPSPLIAAQVDYSDGGQIVAFSADTGKLLSRFDMPSDERREELSIRGLGVAADGDGFLVTGSSAVVLCNSTGKVLHRISTKAQVSRLLFLPAKDCALACGEVFGSPLYFLDLATGKAVAQSEHRWNTVSLDVSSCGQWAVTGGRSRFEADRNHYLRNSVSEGGEVVLWNVAARRPVAKVNACVDSASAVGISADGRWIAVAEDGDDKAGIIIFERIEK